MVWNFGWQREGYGLVVCTDSDWGGVRGDRRSSSGGAVFVGAHCLKTWSSTQGAVALSSAEAEFYAMIEAVTRAKSLISLPFKLGFRGLSNVVQFGTEQCGENFCLPPGLGKDAAFGDSRLVVAK